MQAGQDDGSSELSPRAKSAKSVVLCLFMMASVTSLITAIVSINFGGSFSDTKLGMLRNFVNRGNYDVVFVQEVAVKSFNFYGFEEVVNLNETKRGTAILFKESLVSRGAVKLADGRGVAVLIGDTVFVNIYAPSGAQHRKERKEFFSEGVTPLFAGSYEKIVFGGDFNCVIDKTDSTGNSPICANLAKIVKEMKLCDVWRLKGLGEGFTYRSASSASRIDRIYVSGNVSERVRTVELTPIAFSDHCALACNIKLNLNQFVIRKGTWRINNRILEDQCFMTDFEQKWKLVKCKQSRYANVAEWWETFAKKEIKWFCLKFLRDMNKEEYELSNFYEKCMKELASKGTLNSKEYVTLKEIKAKITKLQWKKLQGFTVRGKSSKIQVVDERTSMYQVVKKEKRRRSNCILRLEGKDGNTLDKQEDISRFILDHFRKEFARPKETVVFDNSELVKEIEKNVTQDDNNMLCAPYSREEITRAVGLSSNNKSPGHDGLSAEFYKKVWPIIGEDLTQVFNVIVQKGKMIVNQDLGIVFLIPKVTKPKKIDDFRPVTLLNCDIKILARAVAARLDALSEKLMHPMQVRRGGARNITAALCDIRDLINYYCISQKKSCVIGMDFKGAFNAIRHDFILKVLEKRGVDNNFLRVIAMFTNTAKSKIMLNGELTQSFAIGRSVRQGCPLSALLFSIAVCPLVSTLSSVLEGTTFCRSSLAISSFADDVIVTLRSKEEAEVYGKTLKEFTRISGLCLNEKKTQIMCFNGWEMCEPVESFSVTERLKVLGVVFTKRPEEMYEANWPTIVNKLRGAVIDSFSRQLNLLQRVWFLNTFALSKLWYVAQIVPFPRKHAEEVRKIIYGFLWNGSIFKASYQLCCRPTLMGGLGLIDPGRKCDALLCGRWLDIALKDPEKPSLSGEWLGMLGEMYPFHQPEKNVKIPKDLYQYKRFWLIKNKGIEFVEGKKSHKVIYEMLMNEEGYVSRMECKHPNVSWIAVYKNMANNCLNSSTFSQWFCAVNDILPTKQRLLTINKSETEKCDECGQVDTVEHRLTRCHGTQQIWCLVKKLLAVCTKKNPDSFKPEVLVLPDIEPDQGKRFMIWLLGNTVCLVIGEEVTDLGCFKAGMFQRINDRVRSWLDEQTFEKVVNLLYN